MSLSRLILVVAALLCPTQGFSQPTFDVASVKPTYGGMLEVAPRRAGGRIRWITDLHYLLGYAYGMSTSRISGTFPKDAPICAIEATTDPSTTDAQIRLMFQSLLAERFKMTSHREFQEAAGYALTLAKGRLKIREAKPAEDGRVWAVAEARTETKIIGNKATMLQFCQALERQLQTFVLDETGLKRIYDFEFRYARENAVDSELASLFRAIQEDLGLKLEKKKGAIETLVVDHLESVPVEN